MKIDYASYTFTPPSRKTKMRRSGLFLSIFVLIAVIALTGWLYVKVSSSPALQHFSARFKTMFSHPKPAGVNKVTQGQAEVAPPVEFNFYSELPKMHVTTSPTNSATVEKSAAPVEKKAINLQPAPVVPPTAIGQKYILQLGIYNDVNGASQHRLSLLLMGFETQVIPVAANGGKVYRVQQGPFANNADAKAAQKKLLKKGLEGTIKVE